MTTTRINKNRVSLPLLCGKRFSCSISVITRCSVSLAIGKRSEKCSGVIVLQGSRYERIAKLPAHPRLSIHLVFDLLFMLIRFDVLLHQHNDLRKKTLENASFFSDRCKAISVNQLYEFHFNRKWNYADFGTFSFKI